MEQGKPRKVKHPLYKGTSDDRSNLEMEHAKNLSMSIRYSQVALSILVLGATIAAFFYLILENVITDWKRPVICLVVFLSVGFLAGRKFYLSWRNDLRAQFIEELLGFNHTWTIKRKSELEQFLEYGYYEKPHRRFKRRYCRFLHKIYNRRPFTSL